MRQITGDQKRYPFTVLVVGNDLIVQNERATWFGGPNDPGDNGIGASGVSTKDHPQILGCALPMQGWRMCKGTPLPHLPWFTAVEITWRGLTVLTQLIDVGPSPRPLANAAIDLTPAVFAAFGIALKNYRPRLGDLTGVSFRVIGGAPFL